MGRSRVIWVGEYEQTRTTPEEAYMFLFGPVGPTELLLIVLIIVIIIWKHVNVNANKDIPVF